MRTSQCLGFAGVGELGFGGGGRTCAGLGILELHLLEVVRINRRTVHPCYASLILRLSFGSLGVGGRLGMGGLVEG